MTPRKSSGAVRRSTPSETEPLIGVYRERGILIEVDGMGDVEDITSGSSTHSRRESARATRPPPWIQGDRGVEIKTPGADREDASRRSARRGDAGVAALRGCEPA